MDAVTRGGLPTTLFVGGYGAEDEPSIHAFDLDESGSRLTHRRSFSGIANPSFLAVHPDGDHLFAVSEVGGRDHGSGGSVHAYRIERDEDRTGLVAVNNQPSEGDHPCHLRIDRSGRWVAVANYGSGSVAVLPIESDGSLRPAASVVQHAGRGPVAGRQEAPHSHSTIFSPDNRFLVVADLGIDRLMVYAFDDNTGALHPHDEVVMAPGSGPRHLAFHPGGDHLFVANELDNTVTAVRWHGGAGEAGERDSRSTIPADTEENVVADVQVAHSGSHVYVSNRGDDSLAVFAFDPATGLERIAIAPSGGAWPRGFAVGPRGRNVVVANRHSDDVAVLPLTDGGAGLGEPTMRFDVTQPSCVVWA